MLFYLSDPLHPPSPEKKKKKRSAVRTHMELVSRLGPPVQAHYRRIRREWLSGGNARACPMTPLRRPSLVSSGRRRSPWIIIERCCFNLMGASLVLSYISEVYLAFLVGCPVHLLLSCPWPSLFLHFFLYKHNIQLRHCTVAALQITQVFVNIKKNLYFSGLKWGFRDD